MADKNRSELRCASTAVVHEGLDTVVHWDIAHGVNRQSWLNPGLVEQHMYLFVTSSKSYQTTRPSMTIVKVRESGFQHA